MAKAGKPKGFDHLKDPERYLVAGPGGATHQTAEGVQASLTTNQGVIVADNQNTLKSGGRGPSLLEQPSPQAAEMSCYSTDREITSICADYLVELRGIEPRCS